MIKQLLDQEKICEFSVAVIEGRKKWQSSVAEYFQTMANLQELHKNLLFEKIILTN